MRLKALCEAFPDFDTDWEVYNQRGFFVKTRGEARYDLKVISFIARQDESDNKKLNLKIIVEEI